LRDLAGLTPAINPRHGNNDNKTKSQTEKLKMKTLYLIAPSILDGPMKTIGPKGRALALRRAKTLNLGRIEPEPGAVAPDDLVADIGQEHRFSRLFYAPLVSCLQTAMMFCDGLGYLPQVMPTIFGLGDEEMLKEIFTEEFKTAVANDLSELSASLKVHSIEQSAIWANSSQVALISMFNAMADGEIAVGFFPAIALVLAAWSYGTNERTRGVWSKLGPMEGLISVSHDDRDCLPYVAGKIEVVGSAK